MNRDVRVTKTGQTRDKEGNKGRSAVIQVAKEKLVRRGESTTGIHQVSRNIQRTVLRSTPKELLEKKSKNIPIVKWTIDGQDSITVCRGG